MGQSVAVSVSANHAGHPNYPHLHQYTDFAGNFKRSPESCV